MVLYRLRRHRDAGRQALMLELVSSLILPVFLLVAALLVLLAVVLLWRMWRERRLEHGRREHQLDSVYNARTRRERDDR